MDASAPPLDQLPCAALVTDGEGRVRYGNAALRALVGAEPLSRPEVRLEELLPPASRIFLQTHVWPLLRRHGRVDEIQLQFRGADGLPRPVLLNASCDLLSAPPSAMQVSWVIFITAERQRFEAELLRTRQRLQNLLLSANAGTWEWNVQTGALKVNARWAEILGRRLGELGGLDQDYRWAQVHPDDAAPVRRSLDALLEGGQQEHLSSFRVQRADGSWAWVQERGRLISRLPDHRPEWVFGTLVDISEDMAQRAALRRSEALLNRTNALAGVGGWELDLRTSELFWSEQTCSLHGVPAGYRPQLQEALAFYTAESRPQIEAVVQRALAEGSGWDLELPFVQRDGTARVVRTLGVAEYEDGAPVRLLGALQDVTEQHRLNLALQHAKAAAEAASEAKSMFLANMSHEIRTPMNAVIGIASLLAGSPLNDDQRQLLGKLQLAGRSLMAVIDDVLDLAKIEAGALAVEALSYSPVELGLAMGSLFGEQARAKGLRWRLEIAPNLPDMLRGDPQRLQQVLSNLLSNAIKFTAQGEVSLHIERAAAVAGEERLRLAVRDSGIGIAPDAQARLFQPFVQAEASTTRRFGGTGLGLSIAKRLVELMGGALSLSSEPDQGSEFVVLLPLQRGDAQAVALRPVLGANPLAGLRLLVVDDSEVNLEVARRLLEHQGAAVQCESQAELALTRLQQGETFDVVLMDIQMPGMDGLQATRQIRKDLQLLELPVIALTAGALVEERRRAGEAGMDDFLTKPLDPDTLVRCLRRHIEARRNEPLPTAAAPAARPVDDPLPPEWPLIEGIEAAEAAHRLAGDAALFRRLLARLLSQHDATWLQLLAQGEPSGLTAGLHKLRGAAGMLGARRIHALASEAEECLRAGLQPEALRAQLDDLVRALTELTLAAQGRLEETREPPPAAEGGPVPDAAERYPELLVLLRQQDLAAAPAFALLMPWLHQLGMASDEIARMQRLLEDLDFDPVLARLSAWRAA